MKQNTVVVDGQTLLAEQKSAPRIDMKYEFTSSPEKVFSIIGHLEGITRYFPMIYHATVNSPDNNDGEGSVRVCRIRGMGAVSEKIVWWSNPDGFAYKASGTFVPLKNHLGVIMLTRTAQGGTTLEWKQYFQTRFGPLGWMFPFMMKILMGKAIKNIRAIV
ncbi:MAG TPA: SRPBCC family protein [Gammaproteobacteria bacterium]|nr:SRPBCC family protein [Gammaproteobacteria bacterium]